MNTKKVIGLLLIFGFLTVMISSCKKYDEGGQVSKTEKNLKNSWKLQKYLRNGNDETAIMIIKNYEETYSDNDMYYRTYIDSDNELFTENGFWKFDKEQKRLMISGVSSLEITDNTGTVSSSHYNILKLDKDEFWYHYTNGGDRHEFQFVKK